MSLIADISTISAMPTLLFDKSRVPPRTANSPARPTSGLWSALSTISWLYLVQWSMLQLPTNDISSDENNTDRLYLSISLIFKFFTVTILSGLLALLPMFNTQPILDILEMLTFSMPILVLIFTPGISI